MDPQDFMNSMQEKYQEKLVIKGVSDDKTTSVEWYENNSTGTWTLIERKQSMVCVLASGEKGPNF